VLKRIVKTNVIAVPSNTSIYDALKIMKENNIKRMPIVDNGKLVGMVTRRGLKNATPSKATTLSIYELNYLLSKMTVRDVMHKNVITVTPDTSFEQAAYIMHKYQIGGLPVLENGKLVGYISSNDLFDVMVQMNGLDKPVTRFTIEIPEDKTNEAILDIVGIMKDNNVEVKLLSIMSLPQYLHKKHLIIRTEVVEDYKKLINLINEKGYEVVSVIEKTRIV